MVERVCIECKHLKSLLWLDVESAKMFPTSRVKAQVHDAKTRDHGPPRKKKTIFCFPDATVLAITADEG